MDKNAIFEAMKNEAYARCRYQIYAEIAREDGLHYYAKVLEEIAENELSHFREFMRILNMRGDTLQNLQTAAISEREESDTLYPQLKEHAIVDGELNTARLFQQIAKIEALHLERIEHLAKLIEEDSVFKRDTEIKWKCRTCGYIHVGKEPPNKCPGCQNGKNFYEPEDFGI